LRSKRENEFILKVTVSGTNSFDKSLINGIDFWLSTANQQGLPVDKPCCPPGTRSDLLPKSSWRFQACELYGTAELPLHCRSTIPEQDTQFGTATERQVNCGNGNIIKRHSARPSFAIN
jgi:hypothetical protein